MKFRTLFSVTTRYHGARLLAAAVLLYAACAKWGALASDSFHGEYWWDSRGGLGILVVAELAGALWLLAGLYPRASWLLSTFVFLEFAVFAGYLSLKGARSCPCFGTNGPNPAVMAGFDLGVAAILAICPPPGRLRVDLGTAPWRLPLVALLFILLAIPAMLDVVYYRHAAMAWDLRSDERLRVNIRQTVKHASSEQLATILCGSTGLTFTVDDRLLADQPDYGSWNLGAAWSVMLGLAEKQKVPVRWDRTETGYQMVPARPLYVTRATIWFGGGLILCAASGAVAAAVRRNGLRAVVRNFGFTLTQPPPRTTPARR
jgi:hypothetical protein